MGGNTLEHDRDKEWFKRLEKDGILLDQVSSLGWGIWLWSQDNRCLGYLDECSLRKLADEIESRNKPFWDEYNAHCAATEEIGEPFEPVDFVFPDT